MGRGERGELRGGQRATVAALRRDERRAEYRQRLEHHPWPLVPQNRADDGPAAGRRLGKPRQQPADACEVVRSVPDLERVVATPLEPAGQRDVVGGVRVDGPAEERLRRCDRQREVAAPGDDDGGRAVLLGELAPLGLPRTTVQPGCTTASFSAAIASRVSPSTSMWSSATLVRTTTRLSRTLVAS